MIHAIGTYETMFLDCGSFVTPQAKVICFDQLPFERSNVAAMYFDLLKVVLSSFSEVVYDGSVTGTSTRLLHVRY